MMEAMRKEQRHLPKGDARSTEGEVQGTLLVVYMPRHRMPIQFASTSSATLSRTVPACSSGFYSVLSYVTELTLDDWTA